MRITIGLGVSLALGLVFSMPAAAQEAPVAGKVAEGSLKGKTLTFVSYGGVYQDGQLKALEDFVTASGVNLLSDGPTEQAKIQAQVEAGNVMWDVVDTGDLMPFVHCGKLFQKLDFSKIDISKIPPGQVGECSVPAMNYAVVLMYKKSTYGDNPPTSWADFFDTKKFPGTRAIPGYGDAEGYMIELALLNDGVEKDKLFPADIDRALNKYRGMRDDLILWQTGSQSQQMMESGETDMAIVWSGRGKAAVANGAEYEPVWKDWVVVKDQLTIPLGTKNLDGAYALINAYLGQKAQEIMTETTSYSPINIDAKPKVDELTTKWLTSTPEKLAQAYNYNISYWVDHNTELNEKWASFIAGN
ncbi:MULTISPECIES: extracellular solute-binding protein [Alphaproteobacteria]|uniref:ABC transporter n=2 Tax=Alphaproteobacteria TaxID=28211 RepID=A0A512HN17_9HYPH|nr:MULTISPECIES: extracellular solute-binding protein [Alphaproteobacteria]GEO86844.1 ABC transporter [Ciceribacter naphthalenivorans]GLR23988.1 ABC transporter [Ciceribacter naphthalenivorans]GLT06844.1 ABC transporter [Sphingomonas psychrolutea]